jgi:hypothetical protein
VRQQHPHSSLTSSRHGREGRRRTTGKKLRSAARKKRRQLKLDRLKPVPQRLKPAPPTKARLDTGYSQLARVSYVLALKPPMLSISPRSWLPIYMGHFPLD